MAKSTASETHQMPEGIPYIIGNEAAERFSFYGMKAALVVFMTQYLHLMGSTASDPMSSAQANANQHYFVSFIYLTPLLGAIIADRFLGKYKTIIWLSIVYCFGHGALALMGIAGPANWWLLAGLGLIGIGGGGIKPCVSAHVGDQFGVNNQHLLTKVFNWFYFSINLGAALSNLFIPWILKWYGPHWAFGIPGSLMALATLTFWFGSKKFVHIPAAGTQFTKDFFSGEGIQTTAKLCSIFFFIPIFWALFDQTASSWVFQAIDMDRVLFGYNILPSQVQAANPFLILILIPFFTYVIYPLVNKVWPLNPLRKIGIGLFITVIAFGCSAMIQEWIDVGQRPSIAWQILAYALLTSAEIMVSIVCLEFAYTQAPKSMKSMIMSIFLLTVALGNAITGTINHFIQTRSPLSKESSEAQKLLEASEVRASAHHETWFSHSYEGFDGVLGTDDDIVTHFTDKGVIKKRDVPAEESLLQAAKIIEQKILSSKGKIPITGAGTQLISEVKDPWGNPMIYRLMNGNTFRITSIGPDKIALTQWDTGIVVEYQESAEHNDSSPKKVTWLEQRKEALGFNEKSEHVYFDNEHFTRRYIAGGMYKLEGANYFWFFTGLMFVTALVFIPVSMRFQLRDEKKSKKNTSKLCSDGRAIEACEIFEQARE
ncbi:MAG: POT family MFS transporter [Rubritalea sp.]|uniref:POT family MFS transporter n=1 Tax=Rubritalea sp. TaxID=2109375 RepID=UPI0032421DEB